MSSGQALAYAINGQAVDPQAFYEVACNPQRHVVVEACAGAGKTWMLVSRMVRALLEGASPSSILAITFTRKAAGEMRHRLESLLKEFAQASEQTRVHELRIRGLDDAQARLQAPLLGQLYERWLDSSEQPRISTIHGWFSGLIRGLPLDVLASLGLPAQWQLLEDVDAHWPDVWQLFLRQLQTQQGTPAHQLLMQVVVGQIGLTNFEGWMKAALQQRMEITLAQQAGTLLDSVPAFATVFPAFASHAHPCDALFEPRTRALFADLARELGQSLTGKSSATATKLVTQLVDAYLTEDSVECFQQLKSAFLTDKDEPRSLRGVKHPRLDEAQAVVLETLAAMQQHGAHLQHRAMVWASHVLFDAYASFKQSEGLVDMNDLELAAAKLHGDEALAGWVQERLDIRIRHLLIDEFQDTSPLQWHTLHHWMGAYAGAGGGQPMRVFVVGDPKQSIYGFRRADPRVFSAASQFIQQDLGGAHLACDHTRRNSQAVIQAVNRVMGHVATQGGFAGFRQHTTDSQLPGRVRVLPDIQRMGKKRDEGPEPDVSEDEADGWRDSLQQARHEPSEVLVQQEARQLAQAIASLLDPSGVSDDREVFVPGDVFVLGRKRADLAWMAQALAELGIAHVFPERTVLMETAEAQDLLAVLECLVMPWRDLALARALKCPAFEASDEVLMALARHALSAGKAAGGGLWWQALMDMPLDTLADMDKACVEKARQLLTRWRDQAQHLPPHDLLQLVVDDSGWRQALTRRLSPAMAQQALVYLDAVVAEALMLWGGRDATPLRWWQALKKHKAMLPTQALQGVVQLLTVHGAKGLEAKVVCLLNTDPKPSAPDPYQLMVDWPPHSPAPTTCAFVGKTGELPPNLLPLRDKQRQVQYLEECNALYVAMTRAQQELVVSRVAPATVRSEQLSWWQHLWASEALLDAHRWQVQVSDTIVKSNEAHARAAEVTLLALPALAALPAGLAGAADVAATVPELSSSSIDTMAWQGRVVHRALEWATAAETRQRTRQRVAHWVARAGAALPQLDKAQENWPTQWQETLTDLVWDMLHHPSSQAWLDPAQCDWAGNEVELWHQGQLLRLDRLVAKRGPDGALHWWVIDFKWHDNPLQVPAYVEQLLQYVQAVSVLEPQCCISGAFINRRGEWLALPQSLYLPGTL